MLIDLYELILLEVRGAGEVRNEVSYIVAEAWLTCLGCGTLFADSKGK